MFALRCLRKRSNKETPGREHVSPKYHSLEADGHVTDMQSCSVRYARLLTTACLNILFTSGKYKNVYY